MGPSIIFKWLFTAKGGGGVHEEPLLDGPRRWLEYPCWSGCHDPCISSPQPGKYFRLHKREQSHSQINFLFAILGLKSVLVCTHPTNAGRSQWTRLLWWVGSTWQKLGCWPRRTSIKQVSGVRKSLPRALWVAWWSFSILLAAVIFVSPFFKDCHQKKQISMLRCRCHFGFALCFFGAVQKMWLYNTFVKRHKILWLPKPLFKGSWKTNLSTTNWSFAASSSPWISLGCITTGTCQVASHSIWLCLTVASQPRALHIAQAVLLARQRVWTCSSSKKFRLDWCWLESPKALKHSQKNKEILGTTIR